MTSYNRLIKREVSVISRFLFISKNAYCKCVPKSAFNQNMIGLPDNISNLRPIVIHKKFNESRQEKEYREFHDKVQAWNQEFWKNHNKKFMSQKETYLKRHLPADKSTLTADEMSVFYKQFLDENWRTHTNYNVEWYRKNFYLLYLAARLRMYNIFSRNK